MKLCVSCAIGHTRDPTLVGVYLNLDGQQLGEFQRGDKQKQVTFPSLSREVRGRDPSGLSSWERFKTYTVEKGLLAGFRKQSVGSFSFKPGGRLRGRLQTRSAREAPRVGALTPPSSGEAEQAPHLLFVKP